MSTSLDPPVGVDHHDLSFAGPDGAARFDFLYRAISPRLRSYLRRAAPGEGDDIAADVWLSVSRLLGSFRGDVNGFEALVFTIARRRVTDHRRRRSRRRTDVVANEAMADRPGGERTEADVIDLVATGQAIAEIVARLPRAQADVVLLRVVHDLSVDQVAAMLDRSPGSVRILQHRALKRLRA